MKKESIYIIILVALLIGVVTLIVNKNVTSKTTTPEINSPTTVVSKPTAIPSITKTEKETMKKQYDSAPAMQIDSSKKYQATMTTSEGEIVIELYADKTPTTVNNFVFLSNEEFYNDTIFHRAIDGFMIQGGDPEGTGMGGPGYRFEDEEFEGEYSRGTLAMANAGPNTNGSQFFVMHKDYPLPPNYIIFGKVIKGLEVVDKIATAPVTTSLGGEKSKPVNPVTIKTIVVTEN
jgi:cyclophilin family peptidyl-prolyl cis-trans isomerase